MTEFYEFVTLLSSRSLTMQGQGSCCLRRTFTSEKLERKDGISLVLLSPVIKGDPPAFYCNLSHNISNSFQLP